ncbi:site-2 protease family protein [Flavitalea sp. BT771]|uniref:site-2 protease family protein n=1 Tax=Flavitalea sp. BT771 TaxID=3063329 RepID=UPI0026E3B227|nr:site-2 protease family protein [Flavitalea sp. BT771]MDO6429496.1 site-2 protease family protein [Flavitalea sp. BT771]MDV6218376.1 site-2 protease family protein [Flavitalea sp. BT771]
MKGSIKIIDIRGIHIFIHWTFLFLMGWLIIAGFRYGNDIRQLAWSILFILAAIASVTVHEAAHAIVARLFGIKAKNIVLLPIGGTADIEKFPDNPAQELAISIAGPVVNVVVALLLWWGTAPHQSFWTMPQEMGDVPGKGFLYILRIGNIGLAGFNLIPAFPMDGGRILRALLGFRYNYVRATYIATIVGKIIAVAFIGLGVISFSAPLAIIGLFILSSASTEEYYLRLRSLAKGVTLSEAVMYDFTSLQADMSIHEAAAILSTNHSKYFILMDKDLPAGAVNRLEIVKAIAEMKYNNTMRTLVREELECLDGELQVDAVLEKLARDDERVFPVMNEGKFAGIVTFTHIIEYLLLHKAGSQEFGRLRSLVGLMR